VPRYCPRCGETLHTHSTTKGETRKTARKAYEPAKKEKKSRGPSAYNLEYKKQYAKLQKKHPRTSFAGLAKKAHAATKKVRK
jgi:DNA-directed RNA polymerase subunit M/transcription elongation factor TFIIS